MQTVVSPSVRHPAGDGAPLAGLRVLIVEDQALSAIRLKRTLEDQGADVVGVARSVTDARHCLQEFEVDAAILDVGLEGGDVYPLADELRERNIPFLFLSGRYLAGPTARFYKGVPNVSKSDPEALADVIVYLRTLAPRGAASLH